MSATLAFALLLQGSWVVDPSNGPGTNFTDLPPAVAAAQSGDVIFVRAGSYSGFAVAGKSLTIRGDDRDLCDVGRTTMAVDGESCVLSGLRFESAGTGADASSLLVTGAGQVALLDCLVVAGESAAWEQAALMALAGVEVHASRCDFAGSLTFSIFSNVAGDGVRVAGGSSFAADDCSIGGGLVSTGSGLPPYGGRGLVVVGGSANLTDTHCYGGPAGSTTFIVGLGGSAIVANGFVRVGGSGSRLQAGANMLGYPSDPGLAIELLGGQAIVHEDVVVVPGLPGATLYSPGVVTGEPAVPRIDYVGVEQPSGDFDANALTTFTIDGLLPNAPFLFFLGTRPAHSFAFGSLLSGELLVDLASGELVLGTLDSLGGLSVDFAPSMSFAGSLGVPLYAQVGVFDFGLGRFRTSNVLARTFSL